MFSFDVASRDFKMSPGVNGAMVIEISSDDEFECDFIDLTKPRSKGRKHRRHLKDSSVKRRRVDVKPKTEEPVLPWKKEQQKHKVVSDDDLHLESYLQKSYKKAPDVHSRSSQIDGSHSTKPKCLRESDKHFFDFFDVRHSSVAFDHKSKSKNERRKIFTNGAMKPLLDIVPKEEPELGKVIQTKISFINQNSKRFQSNNDAKPLLVLPCDLQSRKNFCQTQTRLKVDCKQSWKTDERTVALTESDLDVFIDSLKFKQQSQMLNNSEISVDSSGSVQSEKYRRTNHRSKLQRSKEDFENQNDGRGTDFSSSCDSFSVGNLSQSRDDVVCKNSLPSTDEDSFEFGRSFTKRRLRLLDESSVASSEDEFDTELPDLDTIEDQSLHEPMEILTSDKNVAKPEKITKSPRSIRLISSSLVPRSVLIEKDTEVIFNKGDCGSSRDKRHSYLEFPSFLSEPSSNSWLKHSHRDFKTAGSSEFTRVSEFSPYKVALVKELFDDFLVIPRSASTPKGSEQGHACGKRQSKEIPVTGTSCHLASLAFRNLTSFKSRSTLALTAKLLQCLSHPMPLGDLLFLHSALKGAALLHPRANAFPFNSKMLLQVLETVSEVDGSYNDVLTLDFMVSCLEMEFLVDFQSICLRRMRKTKLYELFSSDSALRSIQRRLFTACEKYDPTDRTLIRVLPLLQRLLGIAGAVVITGVDGVSRVASMLVGEYEACRELSLRVVLLESVSFPFHRFVLVRQVLERWRSRSLSQGLRRLMVSDVGSLLDAYLSDRFLSTLGVEQMSAEMVEELVMLLYTLVESYLHMKRDCLSSSYWEKIGLNGQMENDPDLSPLSLLPGYVDLLQTSLAYRLSPKEKLSRKTHIYLLKLACLADICI